MAVNSSQSLADIPRRNGHLPGCKVIFHFVRHGQATHNIKSLPRDEAINTPDPPLTPLGMAQATHLPSNFPPLSRLTHALVSPSSRTLQTLLFGFRNHLLTNNITAIAYPSLRELSPVPCNMGVDVEQLRESMCNEPIDMRLVLPGWDKDDPEDEDCLKRVKAVKVELLMLKKVLVQGGMWKGLQFRRWERDQDIEVLVVSHGGFLKELLREKRRVSLDPYAVIKAPSLRFHNCQYRTAVFPSASALQAGCSPLDLIQDLSTVGERCKISWHQMGYDIEKDVEEQRKNYPN